MKSYFILFIFISFFAHAKLRRSSRKKIWVFFDLGNTIIDTKTHNYNPMFYMQEFKAKDMYGNLKWKDGKKYQSAREYIEALKKNSFKLGLLTDVPEEWGLNYPSENPVQDLASAKIIRLIDFLSGKVPADKTSWKEGESTWDYSPFGHFVGKNERRVFKGALFLPQNNTERKNKASKVLFERGLAWASQHSKQKKFLALYIGEDLEEMQLAEEAGMIPFQVGVSSQNYFYPPPEKIRWYAETYQKGLWRGLGEKDFD